MINLNNINLEEIDRENLEKVKLMIDISKIQADIEATRQSVNESRATVEQIRANTEKMQKEARWYPWLPIFVSVLALIVAIFK